VDSGTWPAACSPWHAGLAELKHQPVLSANALRVCRTPCRCWPSSCLSAPAPELAKKNQSAAGHPARTQRWKGPPQTLAAATSALGQIHRTAGALAESLPTDTGIEDDLYYGPGIRSPIARASR